MKPNSAHLAAASIFLTFGLAGCGLQPVATTREPTKFLKSTGTDISKKIDRLPFEHSWRDPKSPIAKYKYIVVKPVTTAFLDTAKWTDSKSPYVPNKQAYLRRCNALARHWTKTLNTQFSAPVCVFYKTTDTSKPGTLILEVALTEVTFDRALVKAEAPPVPTGTVPELFTGPAVCAFEARVTDAATGKLVSTAADRRGPEIKLLDPDRAMDSKPNEKICDEWAQQLMMSSNVDLYPTVRRSWFRLF